MFPAYRLEEIAGWPVEKMLTLQEQGRRRRRREQMELLEIFLAAQGRTMKEQDFKRVMWRLQGVSDDRIERGMAKAAEYGRKMKGLG